MPIFKAKRTGYRGITQLLSISAIFPPPPKYRHECPDRNKDDEPTFHLTIVNDKLLDTERSAFIQLDRVQLRKLHKLISDYLETGITKEITFKQS